MAYVCPRDNKRLTFSFTSGGWKCTSCKGSLLFGKNLRKIPALAEFITQLELKESQTDFKCPACNHQMSQAGFYSLGSLVEIDRCESCHSVWFDPEELRKAEEQASNSGERLAGTELLPYTAWEAHQVVTERKLEIAYRAFSLLLVAIGYWVYSQTYVFANEYQGGFGRYRAVGPEARAWSAGLLGLICLLTPRRLTFVLVTSYVLLLTALIIWWARF